MREVDQVCRYEGCGKVCKNKAGLGMLGDVYVGEEMMVWCW